MTPGQTRKRQCDINYMKDLLCNLAVSSTLWRLLTYILNSSTKLRLTKSYMWIAISYFTKSKKARFPINEVAQSKLEEHYTPGVLNYRAGAPLPKRLRD
jgi:hypothetical protein